MIARMIGIALVLTAWTAVAEAPSAEEPTIAMDPYEFASQFTVKVINRTADIFDPDISGGHGTGFFIGEIELENGKTRGVIFTNAHVVNKDHVLEARHVTIQFQTDTEIPDTVDAEVLYESKVNDFAVLGFDLDALKRTKDKIHPAPLPSHESPLYNFSKNYRKLQGMDAAAHGYPLDSDAVTTYGKLTGRHVNIGMGDFIQTQTPINPGNSGGPLISLGIEPGTIIGMNTMKVVDADNVGYAIPIGVLMDEFEAWMKNPDISRDRRVGVKFGVVSQSDLKILDYTKLVTDRHPDFFNHFKSLLKIQDADPNTGLRTNDIVLTMNGEMAGPSIYGFRKSVQNSDKVLAMEVIRNGQVLKVEVPIADSTRQNMRREIDFVYVSGMFFRELESSHFTKERPSSVSLEFMLDTPELTFGQMTIPDQHSLVVGVNIANRDYKIETLKDFKKVLAANKDAKFMRLSVREPLLVRGDKRSMVVPDEFGLIRHQSSVNTYNVPIMETITPQQFSINRFIKNFSFDEAHPESRDWRSAVRPAKVEANVCENILAKGA